MVSTVDLLHNLRQFIMIEAENQRQALERQWSKPLAERVNGGWAIEGLRVEKVKEQLITLQCDSNISRFREGDLLVLHQGNPQDPFALHVELEYDGEVQLEATIHEGHSFFLIAKPEGWIADQDMLDLSNLYLEALDQVADSMLGRSTILPMLNGSLTPQMDFSRYERSEAKARESGLNDSQIEAVAQGYSTSPVHLIQGPPGTGKTVVLAHLVKQLVDDGQRVLVTALTHRAIDNALSKIAALDPGLPVCKICHPTHAKGLEVPAFGFFSESGFGDLASGYAIGATPFATMTKRLANVEFDTVIFDEASQITLPLAIMAMLRGAKYIFIGDEKQLPPVTTSEGPLIGKESIFSYLSGRGYETMLNVTYRMNDALSAWPSRTFYNGELQPSPIVAIRRLILDAFKTRWDFALAPEVPAVFLDLCHQNTTVRSRTEAMTVCELILALMERGIPAYEIGVVVPYRAQSRLIRSLVRHNINDEETLQQLIIDTVERMQGQEREVVIVSLTTASPAFAEWVAEFFFQPERLNVAITRPRTKLILVGSHYLLKTRPKDPELAESVELLKDLVAHCRTITVPDGNPI